LSYSRDRAAKEVERAKNALKEMPDSQYKNELLNLADFSISRVS
jgi:geranylgeranyl pyrophosphate synthase